jgi:hypothetical protein
MVLLLADCQQTAGGTFHDSVLRTEGRRGCNLRGIIAFCLQSEEESMSQQLQEPTLDLPGPSRQIQIETASLVKGTIPSPAMIGRMQTARDKLISSRRAADIQFHIKSQTIISKDIIRARGRSSLRPVSQPTTSCAWARELGERLRHAFLVPVSPPPPFLCVLHVGRMELLSPLP